MLSESVCLVARMMMFQTDPSRLLDFSAQAWTSPVNRSNHSRWTLEVKTASLPRRSIFDVMTETIPEAVAPNPVCVATTGDIFSTAGQKRYNVPAIKAESDDRVQQPYSKAFRGAQFSADGTAIVTQHADRCLRTFVLPENLLSESDRPHSLHAHCSIPSATAISSYALYPHFNLQDPAKTVVACAARDLPIRLVNVIYPDVVHARYALVSPTTEEYISPSSLIWTRDGHRLVAGSDSLISLFDASVDGSGPFLSHKLAHGTRERKQYGLPNTCQGIVSAMSVSADGVLAIGTFQRNLALFSHEGAGECMTSLALSPLPGQQDQAKGNGITHLAWSPCGTYLLVAERQSDFVHVYDVRNAFERVSCLVGRTAQTTQPLGIDVVPTAESFELWAGGKDGSVRMWKNPGSVQGEQAPESVSKMHQREPFLKPLSNPVC